MSKRQKPKKSIFVRLLVIGVSAYMIYTLGNLFHVYSQKSAEYADYSRRLSEKKATIEDLRSLLKEDSQRKLIEKAARERFDFVDPEEEVYVAY